MNKIFLSLASMIVAGFLVKSYRKLHETPPTKEEIYRKMRAEYEKHKRAEHDAIQEHLVQNHLSSIRNKQDGARLMNAIGTLNDLEPVMGRI